METIEIEGVTYERVYVCELAPGMVTAFGETVDRVERVTDKWTRVHMVTGELLSYGHAGATLLIDAGTIED